MKILSKEVAQFYQISSLNRGHLVFTSLIAKEEKLLFLDSHLERLLKGADFLFPEFKWPVNHEKIKNYVKEIFSKDRSDCYMRLTIFDDCLHLDKKPFEVHPDNLKATSAFKIKTNDLVPSFLKISNYLESDLELKEAKFKYFDDVIFFDHEQMATEASSSNVFVVTQNGTIKTPPLSSMVLAGVTRKKLLEMLQEKKIKIEETQISKSELLSAKEIWFTNSVKGIRFVSQFEEKKFEKKDSIFAQVVEQFGRYGELV